jgi:hypothetical protein
MILEMSTPRIQVEEGVGVEENPTFEEEVDAVAVEAAICT